MGALLHGEAVAVDVSARVGRNNRSKVKVRVYGDRSFSWVDLSFQWGACVEAVIATNEQLSSLLKSRFQVRTTSPTQAVHLPPHGPWHGIVFTTLHTEEERKFFQKLFDAWLPGEVLIAVHGKLSRKELATYVPAHTERYHFKTSKATHSAFGGATESVWNFIHLVKMGSPIVIKTLMTGKHYPQSLQASLDELWGYHNIVFASNPVWDHITLE